MFFQWKYILSFFIFFNNTYFISAFSQSTVTNDSLLIIPVVVHVVYSSADQNISDEQIYSQLEALNRDYQKQNSDTTRIEEQFKSLATDVRVEFRLAQIDPYGNSTSGITRTGTSHGPFGNNDIYYAAKGGKDIWDSQKYLNIYVCDLGAGLSGFSSSPGFSSDIDGVVIDYEFFGSGGTSKAPYNLGRTLTHEAGHWLGLKHIWGTGGCDNDDGIEDTPVQDAAVSCASSYSSCGNSNMVQNFMNYGIDSCLLFFTKGQKEAIRAVLTGSRKSVLDNSSYVLSTYYSASISLHPNFSFGQLLIKSDAFKNSQKAQVKVFNLLGKEVVNRNLVVSDGLLKINDVVLTEQLYLLYVQIGNNVFIGKLVE